MCGNYMDDADKELLIKTWQSLSKKNELRSYKPTNATEPQLEYIHDLSKYLDQRDASTLIRLLQLLTEKEVR